MLQNKNASIDQIDTIKNMLTNILVNQLPMMTMIKNIIILINNLVLRQSHVLRDLIIQQVKQDQKMVHCLNR